MLIEGYLEFDNSIPVSIECLGREFPINISGIDGLLVPPSIDETFYEEKKLGPLKAPSLGAIRFVEDFHWGSVNCWPTGDSEIRACKIIFPNIQEEMFEIDGNKIINGLNEWRKLLIENISVELKEDYRGKPRVITSKGYGYSGFGLFKKITGSNKHFLPQEEKETIIIYLRHFKFNQNSLQEILNITSQKKKPLLPFYFFLDAEKAKFEYNYRKSILDSATAIEISFSLIIRNFLPYQEKLNKYITAKHNTLRLKRDLLKTLDVKLPFTENEYTKNLDEIRNRVIHGGYFPSQSEIQLALKITEQTLYSLFPKKYEI
ncbi:hypothetical protein [Flavobacterium sp. GSP14]|uniref:hypothetical protein n=1 Tax=Flavobacterium sp. GSP14 TaxID=3401734 RepID=UPI003AB0E4CD